MAFLHSAQLLYTDCGYPRWTVCFTMPNAVFFYLLFNDFYKKSYNKPVAVKTSEKKNNNVRQPLTNGQNGECKEYNNNNIIKQGQEGQQEDNKKTD